MDWLKEFTRPEGADDPTAYPFRYDVHGEPWACATTGHLLVAVRGGDNLPPPAGKGIGGVAALLERAPTLPRTVPYAALRAFAEPFEAPALTQCEACEGTGEGECEMGYQHPCGDCDGAGGYMAEPEERAGKVGSCLIDRAKLKPLKYLPTPNVVAVEPGDGGYDVAHQRAAIFAGDGWTLLVMPLRDGSVSGEMPELEIPAAQGV